jgi:hypothetical protein
LERGEKLELLVKKTAVMNTVAVNIKKSVIFPSNSKSQDLRRQMYWKSMRIKIFIAILVVLAILGVVFLI